MLIIFDCDGVLVDSEPLAAEAMSRVLAGHGIQMTPRALMQFVGMKQADILAGVEKQAGMAVPPGVPAEIWPATRAIFAESLKPMAGLAALIARLPHRRCVASSSHHERIRFSLETAGLYDLFAPHIFSSSEVQHGKPAPDLFLHAAAKMGVAPADCLVFEDSVAGTTGATAAGMKVIGFAGGGHAGPDLPERLRAAGAAHVIRHWDEAEALI